MNPEQQSQFNEMYNWFQQMQRSSGIPRSTEMALRERLASLGSVISTSSHTVASETQAVNESGSASYNVQKVPDAFLQVTVGGTLYYIPVFT